MINPQSEETAQEKNKEDFYGVFDLEEPPTATNSAQIYVSGTVEDFEKLDIYINNTKAESVTVKGKSSFNEKIGPLKQGENKIYAIARSGTEHSKESETYTVFYKKEPLKLEIESPSADMKTSTQELSIKGLTDQGASLRVNGQPIVVDLSGEFSSTYRLKDGENTLLFVATDAAGNTVEQELKVTYQRED
ncbi:hypothetical protein IPM65_06210 [Candidatus Roizmanbacteria bacterium]|nr:MAG: hypothetical protein IPM65_06210 [Candidatus Roizmanbacteria bacterium]